ncbi:hypothetical protein DIS24_g10720 [Lasiodiplodia hormozganensis]|uniref:Uncharacterized protein n=1 Tax=Lasiodiplodia hormozganensis TaxID=869390 RepID=A0AA40CGF1_9PEZI|nr:hypothetical protein DIS24_g10720 [Lasiodiplodia hormozganensis]
MGGAGYQQQTLQGRYISKNILLNFLESKKAEFGDDYQIDQLDKGGQWSISVKRKLTNDEIVKLQEESAKPPTYGA